jgi:hypothetical protein
MNVCLQQQERLTGVVRPNIIYELGLYYLLHQRQKDIILFSPKNNLM